MHGNSQLNKSKVVVGCFFDSYTFPRENNKAIFVNIDLTESGLFLLSRELRYCVCLHQEADVNMFVK